MADCIVRSVLGRLAWTSTSATFSQNYPSHFDLRVFHHAANFGCEEKNEVYNLIDSDNGSQGRTILMSAIVLFVIDKHLDAIHFPLTAQPRL